ncbi:hypothetical protein B0H15DRAFT_775462 [Mycena belliarum]|uniref:Uncharacterized protein n=1 Tax=Mycena belliarum TaxID=1033014 RepID=A0AAD6XXF4_9AGAR|nr:hypothetical protein B0H15DRAFT_775462 [Mycena belliae]
MSLLSTARRKGIFLARAFSSAGNVPRAPEHSSPSVTLPPEKMRALIAMYHQTETFVTRENLEAKIDEAFTGPAPLALNDGRNLTLKQLENLLSERKNVPTVTEWTPQTMSTPPRHAGSENAREMTGLWSSGSRVRDSKVVEALYGVETLGLDRALPGLETLEDYAATLEQSAQEERDGDYDE